MSVKDGIGNELKEGDLVIVKLDAPFCIGRVGHMTDGGLSLATSQGKKSPGTIQIICPQTIAYVPGPHTSIPVLFKLQNPTSQTIVEDIINKANSEAGS